MMDRLQASNPLVRHVRRHVSMATLFRFPEPGAQALTASPSPPVVVTPPAVVAPQVAELSASPTMAVTPAATPSVAVPAARLSPMPAPSPLAIPAQPQTVTPHLGSPPTSPVPAAASPAVMRQPAPETADSGDDEANWRRLQAIRNLHWQRRAAEAAGETATAETTSPSSTREPSVMPPAAVQRSADPATAPSLQPEIASRAAATQRSPDSSEVPRHEAVSAVPEPSATVGASKPVSSQVVESSEPVPGITGMMTASTAPAGAADGPPEAEPPPVAPLEAVWPVQMTQHREMVVQRREAVTHPIPPQQSEVAATPTTASPVLPRHTAEEEKVRSLLQNVTGGKPTRSAVELIMPRRLRPAVLGQETATQPGATAGQEEPSASHEPVTGQENVPAVQRDRQETAAPATVLTEIGPLPADLWQLLGQEPPRPAAVPSPATEVLTEPVLTSSQENAPTVQRQVEPIRHATATPADTSPESLPPVPAAPATPVPLAATGQPMPAALPMQATPASTDEPLPVMRAAADTTMSASETHTNKQPAATEVGTMREATAAAERPSQPIVPVERPADTGMTEAVMRAVAAAETTPTTVIPTKSESTPGTPAAPPGVPRMMTGQNTPEASPQGALTATATVGADIVSRMVAKAEAPPAASPPPSSATGTPAAVPTPVIGTAKQVAQATTAVPEPVRSPLPAETNHHTVTAAMSPDPATIPITELDRQTAPPLVQRAEAAAPPAATASASATMATTDSEPGAAEETAAPEIDVDELAHRVYSDIKRRLAIEWERIRGRF